MALMRGDIPADNNACPRSKIGRFLRDHDPQTPCLIMDVDAVARRYVRFKDSFFADASPSFSGRIFYALKANPAKEIIARLRAMGCCFDAASYEEIRKCLECGVAPEAISWGNTIKRDDQIALAHAKGVRLFAFDSIEELVKISENAPNSKVFCRIETDHHGSVCPLSAKFGCTAAEAALWLRQARQLGLEPYGISFHVGSQQIEPGQWRNAIRAAAAIYHHLREEDDIRLPMLNLGGGFPVHYRHDVPSWAVLFRTIKEAIRQYFAGFIPPDIVFEPGRAIVADAGIIRSRVLLVTYRRHCVPHSASDRCDGLDIGAPKKIGKDAAIGDKMRWAYMDVGRSNGLTEAVNHRIVYPACEERASSTGRVKTVLAGPTCDWSDVLNDHYPCLLSDRLAVGDYLHLHNTGAYTQSCSTVGFNGFAPLSSYLL